MKQHILILLGALTLTTSACSIQRMAGEEMLTFADQHAIPATMASSNVDAAAAMGMSLTTMMASFQALDLDASQVLIGLHMAQGMQAEIHQREATLRRLRALYEGRVTDAKDALISEKLWHRKAALAFIAAYRDATAAFGLVAGQCPKFEDENAAALALLGVASGALAILHDFNADKTANISLNVPRDVAKLASCFDNEKGWGLPDALQAAIWLSIPGSGPEGVDPFKTLQQSTDIGDKAGISLTRALHVQLANFSGNAELACQILAGQPWQNAPNQKWQLLDAYGRDMLRFEADKASTRERGYRGDLERPQCVVSEAVSEDDDGFDALDDLGDENATDITAPDSVFPVEADQAGDDEG